MSFGIDPNTVVFKGYTQGQLHAAFSAIQDKTNWKMPIRAHIKPEDQAIVDAAIIYFAGGGAEFHKVHDNLMVVEAPGYYNVIGA
jgi:hypothetical protein